MEIVASLGTRFEAEVAPLYPVKALRSCDGGYSSLWLDFAQAPTFEQCRTHLDLQLIHVEHIEGGGVSILMVKEQRCALPADDVIGSVDRFVAYLKALAQVLAHALCHEAVLALSPREVLCADVLKLKRAHSVDDFARALGVKSRLGQWIEEF